MWRERAARAGRFGGGGGGETQRRLSRLCAKLVICDERTSDQLMAAGRRHVGRSLRIARGAARALLSRSACKSPGTRSTVDVADTYHLTRHTTCTLYDFTRATASALSEPSPARPARSRPPQTINVPSHGSSTALSCPQQALQHRPPSPISLLARCPTSSRSPPTSHPRTPSPRCTPSSSPRRTSSPSS